MFNTEHSRWLCRYFRLYNSLIWKYGKHHSVIWHWPSLHFSTIWLMFLPNLKSRSINIYRVIRKLWSLLCVEKARISHKIVSLHSRFWLTHRPQDLTISIFRSKTLRIMLLSPRRTLLIRLYSSRIMVVSCWKYYRLQWVIPRCTET